MTTATVPTNFTEDYSELSNVSSYGKPYSCPSEECFRRMGISLTVIYSLTCLFGVIGNGLVIFITGFRMKKTFTTVFFLNLAIADFIATFFLTLTVGFLVQYMFSIQSSWPIGKEICRFISIIKFLNLYSSIFFLMVISISRYISVRYPIWMRNHQTLQLASWVALGVWILSLALSCAYEHYDIPDINITEYDNRSYNPETLPDNENVCSFSYGYIYYRMKHSSYSIFISHAILSFILPFIVMISCYGATFLRLRRSQFAQSGKPFKAITAVTVAFFVCWFPINLINFIEDPCLENFRSRSKQPCPDLCNTLFATYSITGHLAYFNSCLNPILYVFIGRSYRESLRCSLFSALENAFQEESSPGRTKNKDSSSSAMTESQNL